MANNTQTSIPTVSEMMKADKWAEGDQLDFKAVDHYAREFGRLHVEAIKQLVENEEFGRGSFPRDEYRARILEKINAYPLDKIK